MNDTLISNIDDISWKIIDKMFSENSKYLVNHHLDSYNDFFSKGIFNIVKETNPIKFRRNYDEVKGDYKLQCDIFIGGKNGKKIYYGKPVIYDKENMHYMYPNEARIRNMSYGISIHYDATIEIKLINNDEEYNETININKIFMGKFPIMLQSNLCMLHKLPKDLIYNMGECRNDYGGYFIIDGKEKVVVPQEKFADNMVYIKKNSSSDNYSYSAIIRMVAEDASKPVRTMKIHIVKPTTTTTNNNIVVQIPNVRAPVPLFILMRALGVLSDKDILKYILLDLEKNSNYLDYFLPSIHDNGVIYDQESAIKYISLLTKRKINESGLQILIDYLLPNVGELNFQDKAYFIGNMCFNLIRTFNGEIEPTDRDNFKFKRVELTGSLIYDLFKEYYILQQKDILLKIDKEFFYHYKSHLELGKLDISEIKDIFSDNYQAYFKDRVIEKGFKKAFKGNWGSKSHTKRIGVLQPLNRLSYNSALSHLRKINLPLDASAKVVGPRLLHGTQWGLIDPIDTPDGGNIGLHKHMAMGASITKGYSREILIKWLRVHLNMYFLQELEPEYIYSKIKVFVNGIWCGCVNEIFESINKMRNFRRLGLIPSNTSISYSVMDKIIYIYCDQGRLYRPVYYFEGNNISIDNNIIKMISDDKLNWKQLTEGDNSIKDKKHDIIYDIKEVYGKNEYDETLKDKRAVIDFIDTSESESTLILSNIVKYNVNKKYTHVDIHPSLLLGVMGNQVIFPETNPSTRNLFSCGQSKQSASLYHSNYHNRMDKSGIVLDYGQIPLIKSRYLKYINNEEQPYGENTIVAIMSYTGYNVEDAILINEGAIKRGLFHTTYYTSYESHEESSSVNESSNDSKFYKFENKKRPQFNYNHLDNNGIIEEGTLVNEKSVLMGKISYSNDNEDDYSDVSVMPKKGQLGYVDKSFITDGEEGFRIAKVRIRNERLPAIGDKMASRAGQKGTIGLIIPEEDMPFTESGVKPDLIINPHAIPSRMTIGQLIECLSGKAASNIGAFGDCTAFSSDEESRNIYSNLLQKLGYHSSGNEILYNGMTGEQLKSDIFIGPTYYMRLKHMVKDKINYRARGPITAMTRQAVHGRANDGGLRIGEMERDGIIAHGASKFLNESMIERGDKYHLAICNKTGMVAIYNDNKNIMISPYADGPVKFSGNTESMRIKNISKHGRSFSIIRVPYSFKLLIQELQTMNIQTRIITDDNIDQFEHLATVSNNFSYLTHSKDDRPIILRRIFDKIKNEESKENITTKFDTEKDENELDDDDSVPYAPGSPVDFENITPRTPNPDSPPWAPNTPPEQPNVLANVADVVTTTVDNATTSIMNAMGIQTPKPEKVPIRKKSSYDIVASYYKKKNPNATEEEVQKVYNDWLLTGNIGDTTEEQLFKDNYKKIHPNVSDSEIDKAYFDYVNTGDIKNNSILEPDLQEEKQEKEELYGDIITNDEGNNDAIMKTIKI